MISKQLPLYDLAEWKNGLAFRKIDFSNKGKPVIKIAELKNGITGQTQFTNGNYGEAVSLTRGDMVFSWSGNPETSIDVFWYDLPDGWLNQHIFKVTPSECVDKKYLYYLLKSLKPTFTAIASNKQTTGLGHVTIKDLKELIIDLPTRSTQEAISNYLYALDSKIHLNKQLNDNLQQQAAALFANFYDQAETEVGFTEMIQILGGGTPKTGESSYWNGDIPFFTPKDVGFPYTLTTEKTITEEGLAHCNSRLYPINTVFVTARGTVGKVGLPGVPMAMNQSCYALVGKDTHQLLVYFYTLKAVDRLKHKASGAVFDAITTRDFEAENIMKLSDDDTKAFLDVAEPIYQAVLNNSIENLRLSELRDSLLPKLMNGEIDVTDIRL
ncbi:MULTISPECIES: restriction endonuclease subunit S [Eubacteriales]|uniref:Type I restriction enzyme, S subunit n=1 Tax=Bittarella massiliensis (ex Durand et al. 2017) TaxID=1720313 RepID=A0AAQ1MD79_9FIRM|nr:MULTISPECIES: restriction endonuclease subunit S [Eubacteriales]SHG09757.1 type I restriction enzyme, S subunit [Bittarella massiliensis (ex Durand et al. 2017)]